DRSPGFFYLFKSCIFATVQKHSIYSSIRFLCFPIIRNFLVKWLFPWNCTGFQFFNNSVVYHFIDFFTHFYSFLFFCLFFFIYFSTLATPKLICPKGYYFSLSLTKT